MNLLKKTFAILVNSSSLKETNSVGGIRFAAAGKLNGTLRKSKTSIQMGKLPVQSISKMNLKTHVLQDTEFLVLNYGLFENKNYVIYS